MADSEKKVSYIWEDNFRMDHISAKGRTLMILYECRRCGVKDLETVSTAIERERGNYYGRITRLSPPGWDDCYGGLLCKNCRDKLSAFLRNEDE